MSKGIVGPDDWKEIMEKASEREEELQRMVYTDGEQIVLDVRYEYAIDLHRCDTHEKILWWVLHLSEKTWMTQEILIRFIRLAARQNGLETRMP